MHKLKQKNKQRKNARHFLKSHKESFFAGFAGSEFFERQKECDVEVLGKEIRMMATMFDLPNFQTG